MDKEIRKIDDTTFAIPMEMTCNVADLLVQKKQLEQTIAGAQAEIDRINALLAQAEKVGVKISVEAIGGEPEKIGE